MATQIKYAVVVAGVVLFASLIYTDLPGFPASSASIAASSTVRLKDRNIIVTIADTPEEREKGLSGREGLAPDEGILFVFPEDGKYAFWMKDMRFSIDILWVSVEGTIVDMAQNVSPDSYPSSFLPKVLARYVLELPAGWVEEYNVRVGEKARL